MIRSVDWVDTAGSSHLDGLVVCQPTNDYLSTEPSWVTCHGNLGAELSEVPCLGCPGKVIMAPQDNPECFLHVHWESQPGIDAGLGAHWLVIKRK